MSRSISLRFVCVLALAWTLIPNLVAAQPEAPVAETPAAAANFRMIGRREAEASSGASSTLV